MSHLDEGMLHELLDSELSPADARAARAHLAACAECRALYEEARSFFEESERLVTALDSGLAVPFRPSAVPPSRPSRGLPLRTLAWAASIFLAISLGYYGSDFKRRSAEKQGVRLETAASPAQPAESVAAAAKGQVTASGGPAQESEQRRDAPAAPAVAAKQPTPAGLNDSAAGFRAEGAVAQSADRLKRQAHEGVADRRLAEADQGAPAREAPAPQAAASLNAAAKAAAPAPVPSGAPAFRRIPMEEAVRQLGGTIRLIEGLTPERVESGSGQLVTGARPDPSVVRVIYLDPPRREIWLDQQHGTGPVAAAGDTILLPGHGGGQSLQWRPAPGEWLSLTGFLTADSLGALARRVR
jgi:hypothetical protein